jgi:sulfur carrier protein
MINVQINGESHSFDKSIKVANVVEQLSLTGKKVAIERNGELIPRSQYGSCEVLDGDQLEIVVAVGGG